MKRFCWLAGFSTVALVLVSCGDPMGNTPIESPVSEQTSEQTTVSSNSSLTSALAQAPAAAAEISSDSPIAVPGLLPATDPDQRRAQIARRKADPFAAPPGSPVARVEQASVAQPASLHPPDLTRVLPPIPLPAEPAVTPAPVAPGSTEIANAVQITGVLKIEGKLVAIVEAPDEPTSRSVSVGDYLSGGKVRVKQIELSPGGEPLITLEENGIQVIKSVGATQTSSN